MHIHEHKTHRGVECATEASLRISKRNKWGGRRARASTSWNSIAMRFSMRVLLIVRFSHMQAYCTAPHRMTVSLAPRKTPLDDKQINTRARCNNHEVYLNPHHTAPYDNPTTPHAPPHRPSMNYSRSAISYAAALLWCLCMFNRIRAQERCPTVKSVRAYIKRLRRTHVRIHELVPCAFIGACYLAKQMPDIVYVNRGAMKMTNLMCDANN